VYLSAGRGSVIFLLSLDIVILSSGLEFPHNVVFVLYSMSDFSDTLFSK
jgi:hypothetical protein